MQIKYFAPALILLLISGCGKALTPEQQKYINSVEEFRQEKNNYMKNDPSSPFNQDSNAVFSELKYFDIDTNFVFKSPLNVYEPQDTVIVLGTKGEERKTLRYGYVNFNYSGISHKINVYKGTSRRGQEYYSIWFTDKTTGEETYGVGRYIDFDLDSDSGHIYTIDFNLAYNPYCAYSSRYSCAIPTKEDYLDIAVEAGEKSFH